VALLLLVDYILKGNWIDDGVLEKDLIIFALAGAAVIEWFRGYDPRSSQAPRRTSWAGIWLLVLLGSSTAFYCFFILYNGNWIYGDDTIILPRILHLSVRCLQNDR
jgi:hypothetical protein